MKMPNNCHAHPLPGKVQARSLEQTEVWGLCLLLVPSVRQPHGPPAPLLRGHLYSESSWNHRLMTSLSHSFLIHKTEMILLPCQKAVVKRDCHSLIHSTSVYCLPTICHTVLGHGKIVQSERSKFPACWSIISKEEDTGKDE